VSHRANLRALSERIGWEFDPARTADELAEAVEVLTARAEEAWREGDREAHEAALERAALIEGLPAITATSGVR
jgi:hypothetical protein